MTTPRPRKVLIQGFAVADVRHFWPPSGPAARKRRSQATIIAQAIHHDGVLFAQGDTNYSGESIDEDIRRLNAIHNHSMDQGWGSFPYHWVISPNEGRVYYTLDISLMGAQVADRNHETLGTALMGDFTRSHPTNVHLCGAAVPIIINMRELRRLIPWDAHRQLALPTDPTACPGNTWYTWQHRLSKFVGIQARR
jgi:hypothetical protein